MDVVLFFLFLCIIKTINTGWISDNMTFKGMILL